MSEDPLGVIRSFGVHLDALGARWAAGGSVASSVHGLPRTTADVDLVVSLPRGSGRALERVSDFFVDGETLERELAAGRSYNVFHATSSMKVDLFPAVGRFEENQLARAVTFAGIRIVSPEDTVLAKLRWYRKGGEASERQWRDILGVLAIQGDRLDGSHLERWAARLGVSDLLERARASESGGF